MVGVADQRALLVEPGRRRQPFDALPQTGRRQRRVHVDPGQVGGPIAEHRVELCGARRRVLRPRRLVPAVTPQRLAGVGRRVVGDQLQAVRARCRRPQVETGERQPGRGEVDVAVDESRRDEAAVEIDDVGAGELVAPDVVAAQPHHGAVAHRHRGGVGMARAVHPAVEQQGGRDVRHADRTYGVARRLFRPQRQGGRVDLGDVDRPRRRCSRAAVGGRTDRRRRSRR